jgi:hypothetical protein
VVPPVHVVWPEHDLGVVDHARFAEAARAGRALPLHPEEPGLRREPEPHASLRQWAFLREPLLALRAALDRLGAPLVVGTGEVVLVHEDLRTRPPSAGFGAHEEAGNLWTSTRDRRVRGRADPGDPTASSDRSAPPPSVRRAKLWAVRERPGFAEHTDAVQEKHGSRKAGVPRPDRRSRTAPRPSCQLRLEV